MRSSVNREDLVSVKEEYPLKQGLKQLESLFYMGFYGRVKEEYPLKQGLKPTGVKSDQTKLRLLKKSIH